ncbi:MAG: hypothetical protein WKF31_06090 [Thermoleophilaceae bacterium]
MGAIVLGAATYQMFVGYWPTPRAEGELVAPKINSLPKHVFSRSLASAPWGTTRPRPSNRVTPLKRSGVSRARSRAT